MPPRERRKVPGRGRMPIELGLGGCFALLRCRTTTARSLWRSPHGDFRIGIARQDAGTANTSCFRTYCRESKPKTLSYKYGGRYYMIVSDTEGNCWRNLTTNQRRRIRNSLGRRRPTERRRPTAMLVSDDGIDWKLDEYPKVTSTLMYSDMSVGGRN